MPTTEMTREALERGAAIDLSGQPLFMVNLLRYNAQANYEGKGFEPCSGREAYFGRYVPAFGKVAEGTGIRPFWVGNALAGIVGPTDETWDDVAIVEYPSFEAFRMLVESEAYKADADPHRRAALADWRLIATGKMDLPGSPSADGQRRQQIG